MYNPFLPNNTAAFIYPDAVAGAWEARASRFAQQREHIATAVAAGLSYNEYGLAFPRGLLTSDGVLGGVTAAGALEGICFEAGHGSAQRRSVLSVLQHDHPREPHAHEPIKDPRVKHVLHGLHRDGFYRFNASWAFGELLRSDGALERMLALLDTIPPQSKLGGNAPLPAGALPPEVIAPLASRLLSVLEPVARAYLGMDAEVNGVHAYRLPARDIDPTKYAAGYWHHDRCGARLKAYVLLSDVDAAAHPLQIARGSHRTVWYRYHDMPSSRFSSVVEQRYETVALTGRAGEGFVFDTNALHRATVSGRTARSVVMFELNAANKSQELRQSAGAPCPSSGKFLQPL